MKRSKPERGHPNPTENAKTSARRRPIQKNNKLPHTSAAAIAVMEMGISDYSVIAGAVGLSEEEVEQIDMSDDSRIRKLGSRGIPFGEYFHLRSKIRCPKCSASITIAPCVACTSSRGPREHEVEATSASH